MRRTAAVVVIVALAATASAYVEIETGRFTDPVATVARDLSRLQGAGAPTDVERARLLVLRARIDARTSTFREDLTELAVVLRESKRFLTKFRAQFDPALDLGVARASEEVSLRRDWVADHAALLPSAGVRPTVLSRLAAADRWIARAALATDRRVRVERLRAAEKLLTLALSKAQVGLDDRGIERPSPRLWNGALVGAAGGRIFFTDDPLAGVTVSVAAADVTNAFRLTVEPATPILAYPWEPIGTAVSVEAIPVVPGGALPPVTVRVPWEAHRLGDPTITMLGSEQTKFGADGFAEGRGVLNSTFVPVHEEAPPPHPAVSEERWHLLVFAQHATGAGGSALGTIEFACEERDLVFSASDEGATPTGFLLSGTRTVAARAFTESVPAHSESLRTEPVLPASFTWSLVRHERIWDPSDLSISIPVLGETIAMTGRVSADRTMIQLTGRGTAVQAHVVGVRAGGPAVPASPGSWFAAESSVVLDSGDGVTFGGPAASTFARLVPDGSGGLAAEPGGTSSVQELRFGESGAVAPTLGSPTVDPSGVPAVSISGDGRVTGDGGRVSGWVHAGSGVLVARRADASPVSMSMLVAVRDDVADFDAVFDGATGVGVVPGFTWSGIGSVAGIQTHALYREWWSRGGTGRPSDRLTIASGGGGWLRFSATGSATPPRWSCSAVVQANGSPHTESGETWFAVPGSPSQRRTSSWTDCAISPTGTLLIVRGTLGVSVLLR